ncbi:Calcium-binding EF hand family protein [Rhynchospora pubera]|uniref:Calcium-binding EF hand family protein n=1 Tax=Rhynchospora pubera TaxID=906938 RepID=A0AAV8FC28_9POAL|nr:Calcium-binding EF hand family protein [Rhynchospora pubera]KAJ4789111.1 Calcium-binding EF hand family protein [Rhynchospora pubera]
MANMTSSPFPLLLGFLTLTLILLFLLSSAPSTTRSHHNRRLKLRSSFNFTPPLPNPESRQPGHANFYHFAFDPIISQIEMRREDREWERTHKPDVGHAPAMESQPEWGDFMDAEDYLNSQNQFNVTKRVEFLFPRLDLDPIDGFISIEELTHWNLMQARIETIHRTKRDMEMHDKNKDGFVSFEEYERPSWSWRFDEENSTKNGMGWWREEHYKASDNDGDGLLNITEFNDFLHPADSSNPKLIDWLCKEEIRERDKDKDGKLSFQEYHGGLFYLLRNYDEFTADSKEDNYGDVPAKKLFSQIDKDNNGFISAEELTPYIHNLHPSEHFYAKQQANYLLNMADADKDGKLSLKEMVDNPYAFYSSIFTEEDFAYHDEFR